MSGPSLKKRGGHSSIHEAALHEAREIIELYSHCLKNGEKQKAFRIADVFIEHWESRTLVHAQTEEEGLYREVLEQHPEWEETIINLKRDHELMRRIIRNLKDKQLSHEADDTMLKLMDALIVIDELHNEEEMSILPSD